MTKYIELYEKVGFPVINTDNYIATYLKRNNHIVSGFCDFSRPFRLVVPISSVQSYTYTTTIVKSVLNTYRIFNTFRIDYNWKENKIVVVLQIADTTFAELSISVDRDKLSNVVLEWDGSIYSAYVNYTDNTKSETITRESKQSVQPCCLAIGYSDIFSITADLKLFSFKNTGSSDEIKLVDEIKTISTSGTTKAKLEYLEETKRLIREVLVSKGIDVDEEDPFRQYTDLIFGQDSKNYQWYIVEDGGKIERLDANGNNPVSVYSSNNSQIIYASGYFRLMHNGFSDSDKLSIETSAGNFSSSSTEKRRNSIFTFYRNGSSIYPIFDEKYNNNHPSLGYFITNEEAKVVKHVSYFNDKYIYKPDKYPTNFLVYNPSDKSVTLKAGEYQSCATKPITEAIVTVDTDQILTFDERMASNGYLSWNTSDYSYFFQVSPPYNGIQINLSDINNPDVPDYIRSRKIKCISSSTDIRLYNSGSGSYQSFTSNFTDLSNNMLQSGSLYFRKNSSSSFGFNNIGDQYILRTTVGDGFRNNIDPEYLYRGEYISDPTSLTHTRQLTMLDGSTRLIDDEENRNITLEELRNIDYIDDIYTVNSTDSSSYTRSIYILTLVRGSYQGAYSYGINIDTTYNRLSINARERNSKINLYINVKAGNNPDGFSDTPKYPIY